jgi:hypothetical protein
LERRLRRSGLIEMSVWWYDAGLWWACLPCRWWRGCAAEDSRSTVRDDGIRHGIRDDGDGRFCLRSEVPLLSLIDVIWKVG